MSEEENLIPCKIVRGFTFPMRFTQENIEDTMDFVPGDGDLIIASYPKTGTTWMQYTIMQIKSKGQLFPSFEDLSNKVSPYVEMVGVAAVKAQDKPRFYKHHMAYDIVQKNDKSKCIYTYRNPEDTVASFYHFFKSIDRDSRINFDEFFDSFVSGNIPYGSYFRHVLSFYKHRDEGNLLLVSYEKMHANRREEILRIAKFLGEEYYESLLEDQLLEKVIEHTSFDHMKKNLTLINPHAKDQLSEGEPPKVDFFRKGIVGDGKAVLTESQRQLLKEAAEKILKDTTIFDEWYHK